MCALCYVTDELLEDASALGAFKELLGGMELGFKLGVAVFSGNGAAQPLGILNSGALIPVSKETTQGAATIVRDNLVKMFSKLHAGARDTAAWFCNQDVETQLYAGDLETIFSPAGANGSKYCSLFGAPVVPVEACPALGTLGDIVLANLPDYVIASKPMDMATSIHVQFLTDESAFRFTLRVSAQPLIAAPLTPLNGTVTQSSFVALETRS